MLNKSIDQKKSGEDTSIDLKLFVHINNDAHIAGTQNLEGNNLGTTGSFLNRFIRDTLANKTSFSVQENKDKLSRMSNNLSTMVDLTGIVNSNYNNTDSAYGMIESEIVKKIHTLNNNLNESVLIPGGWAGSPGHAMVYEFKKDSNGNVLFYIYNSGDGISKHHLMGDSVDKTRIYPIKIYQMPKENASDENLRKFVRGVYAAQIEPMQKASIAQVYDADRLYNDILIHALLMGGVEKIPSEVESSFNELLTIGQRTGTCSESCLHEWIKSVLGNESQAKLFIFCFKKYSIERFLKEHRNNMSPIEVDQLALAAENLARRIDKNPSLFSDPLINETIILLKEVEVTVNQYKAVHFQPEVNLAKVAEELKSYKNGTIKISTDTYRALPPDLAKPKEPYVQGNISIEFQDKGINLNQFTQWIDALKNMSNQSVDRLIVDSIENAFLSWPLDVASYADIDDEKKVESWIVQFQSLLDIYASSVNIVDSNQEFTPKRAVALLSAHIFLTMLTQKMPDNKMKAYNVSGIEVNELLNKVKNSPYLVTKVNAIDKRLQDVIKGNQGSVYTSYDINPIEYLKIYIKKHESSEEFRKYLCDIYDKKIKTLIETYKYNQKELDAFKNADLKAEVALLLLLPLEDNLEHYAEDVLKMRNKLQYEKLSTRIIQTLQTFDYHQMDSLHVRLVNMPVIEVDFSNPSHPDFKYKTCSSYDKNIAINSRLIKSEQTIQNSHIKGELTLESGDNAGIETYGDQIYYRNLAFERNYIQLVPDGNFLSINEKNAARDQSQSAKQAIEQMMWHIRSTSDFQIELTLDFFHQHIDLLEDPDYRIYLEKNIFSIQHLDKLLLTRPELFNQINEFIQNAVKLYEKKGKVSEPLLFFHGLRQSFNQYCYQTGHAQLISQVKLNLENENAALKTISGYNLSIALGCELAKQKLSSHLFRIQHKLIPFNEETSYQLFKLNFNYIAQFKNKSTKTSSEIEQFQLLKKQVTDLIWLHETHLARFIQQYIQEGNFVNTEDMLKKIENAKWNIRYPTIMALDTQGQVIVRCDLNHGDFFFEGRSLVATPVPDELLGSVLYKSNFSNQTKNAFICEVTDPDSYQLIRKIELANTDPETVFYEINREGFPYIQHTRKSINNRDDWYELQSLITYDQIDGRVYQIGISSLGKVENKIDLPRMFYSESTRFWKNTEKNTAIIERQDRNFALINNQIVELDENNVSTNYVLNNANDLNSSKKKHPMLSLFSMFEDEKFIEIYSKQDKNLADLQYKIILPRYGLEFICFQDKQSNKWKVSPKGSSHLVLKTNPNQQFSNFKAPLVFENTLNHKEVAYIPKQEFYVTKKLLETGDQSPRYSPFEFDIHNDVHQLELMDKYKIAPYDKQMLPKVNIEKYVVVDLDPNTHEYQVHSTESALYLAYISACQRNYNAAYEYLNQVNEMGGLKGTSDELEMIERIVNAVPRFSNKAKDSVTKNPHLYAIKAHAMSLVLKYNSSFELPQSNITDDTQKIGEGLRERELTLFHQGILGNASEIMQNYDSTRNNIPSHMQLSIEQEYDMLTKLGGSSNRLRVLRRFYKQSELRRYTDTSSSAGVQSRQAYLKQAYEKSKMIQTHKIDTVKHSINLNSEIYGWSSLHDSVMDRDAAFSTLGYVGTYNSLGFTTNDTTFLGLFKQYVDIAKNPQSTHYRELKEYCEAYIRSDYIKKLIESDDKHPSIIPLYIEIILRLMALPTEKLRDINTNSVNDIDSVEAFIKMLFVKIKDAPITVTVEKPEVVSASEKPLPEKYYTLTAKPIEPISLESFNASHLEDKKYAQDATVVKFIDAFKKEQDNLDQTIDDLIKPHYRNVDGHYVSIYPYHERKPIIDELERKIGALRNDFNVKIRKQFIDKLSQLNLTHLLEVTTQYKTNTQNEIGSIQSLILSLANEGPSNLKARKEFELQILGKRRESLTLVDIYRLYLTNDKNEYRRLTGLDDAKIDELHHSIANFIQLKLLFNLYDAREKAIKACQENKSAADHEKDLEKLGQELTKENLADFSKDPALQFFQMAEGKFVYSLQKKYLNRLLDRNQSDEYKNEVIQLIMGGGKSKIITPMVAIQKADGYHLPIVQVKSALLNTNFADLSETSRRLFGQEAIRFEFNRQSPSTGDDFKQLYHMLQAAMVDKKYLVTTGESLQSLELKYLELLEAGSEEASGDQKKYNEREWCRQIKWAERVLSLLKTSGERIIDEIHDEGDPRKELNYTIGKMTSIPEHDIDLEIDMYEFFTKVNLKTPLSLNIDLTLYDVVKDNNVVRDPNQWNIVGNELASQLVNHPKSPIANIVMKLVKDKDQHKELIKKYLLNELDAICYTAEFKMLSIQEKNDLAFLKEQVTHVLPFTLSRKLYDDYGPSRRKNLPPIDLMLPIPYKGNLKPIERARFGYCLENMNYVLQMSIINPIPDNVFEYVMREFIKEQKSEALENVDVEAADTYTKLKFDTIFKDEKESIPFDLSQVALSEEPDYEDMVSKLRQSKAFSKYCLKHVIIPKIKVNPKVLTSNPQNSISMIHTNQGMSGTPYNVLSMHQDLKFDEKMGLGTDGETMDLLIRKKTPVEFQSVNQSPFEFLENSFKQIAQEKQQRYRAFIDVGSMFRGVPNIEVAKNMAEFCSHQLTTIKYILYFDNDEEVLYALDVKTRQSIKIASTEEKVVSDLLKCKPDERFTYYDQVRITGTDIVQDPKSHAIVTFSEKTPQYALMQGSKRMRGLGGDQSVTCIGPDFMAKEFQPQPSAIEQLISITGNRQNAITLNMHFQGTQQKFQNIIRENLLNHIKNIPLPSDAEEQLKSVQRKSELYHLFSRYFEREYMPNHFANSGAITLKDQPIETVLKNVKDTFLNDWIALLKQHNIPFTNDNVFAIENALAYVMQQGINACANLVETKKSLTEDKINELGSEVKVENNLGMEVENEMQQELENEMQQELELEKETLMYDHNATPDKYTRKINFEDILNRDKSSFLLPLNHTFINVDPKPPFYFSENILMSKQYAYTLNNQDKYGYYNVYTKPVEMVLFAEINYRTTAIIISKEEAKYFTDTPDSLIQKELKCTSFSIVSSGGLLIKGKPLSKLSNEAEVLLEQIRFYNGDCQILANTKKPLQWLGDNAEAKMDFMAKKIMPVHPDKTEYFRSLCSRLNLKDKIMSEISNNPDTDYTQFDWESKYPRYRSLKNSSKESIKNISTAFKQLNEVKDDVNLHHRLDNPEFNEWLSNFSEDIQVAIQKRRDDIYNAVKYQAAVYYAKTPERSIPLQSLFKDPPHKLIDFNVIDADGYFLLKSSIENQRTEDVIFILNNMHSVQNKSILIETVFDTIAELAKKSLLKAQTYLNLLLVYNPSVNSDVWKSEFNKAINSKNEQYLAALYSALYLSGVSYFAISQMLNSSENHPLLAEVLTECQQIRKQAYDLESKIKNHEDIFDLDPALTGDSLSLHRVEKYSPASYDGYKISLLAYAYQEGNIPAFIKLYDTYHLSISIARLSDPTFPEDPVSALLFKAMKIEEQKPDPTLFKMLLDRSDVNMYYIPDSETTSLFDAALSAYPKPFLKCLLDKGYEIPWWKLETLCKENPNQPWIVLILETHMKRMKTANKLSNPDELGKTTLIHAISLGSHDYVKKLIAENADVTTVNADDMTALKFAYEQYRNTHMAQTILRAWVAQNAQSNLPVDTVDSGGMTPLQWAYLLKDNELADSLVNQGAQLWHVDNKRRSPFIDFINVNPDQSEKILKVWIRHAEEQGDINQKDPIFHQTPLSWAIHLGAIETVKDLLDKNAFIEMNGPHYLKSVPRITSKQDKAIEKLIIKKMTSSTERLNTPDEQGCTFLYYLINRRLINYAVKKQDQKLMENKKLVEPSDEPDPDLENIRILLASGADPNIKNQQDQFPLKIAIGDYELMQLLLKNGADPALLTEIEFHALTKHTTYQSYAGETHYPYLDLVMDYYMNSILAKGNVNERLHYDQLLPLEYAISKKDVNLVSNLLKAGADVHAKNKVGRSMLDLAFNADPKIQRMMFDHWFSKIKNFNERDPVYNATPLMWAVRMNNLDKVKEIAQKPGVVIELYNVFSINPDFQISEFIFQEYLKARSSKETINTPDAHGKTALDYAIERNRFNTVSDLLAQGALPTRNYLLESIKTSSIYNSELVLDKVPNARDYFIMHVVTPQHIVEIMRSPGVTDVMKTSVFNRVLDNYNRDKMNKKAKSEISPLALLRIAANFKEHTESKDKLAVNKNQAGKTEYDIFVQEILSSLNTRAVNGDELKTALLEAALMNKTDIVNALLEKGVVVDANMLSDYEADFQERAKAKGGISYRLTKANDPMFATLWAAFEKNQLEQPKQHTQIRAKAIKLLSSMLPKTTTKREIDLEEEKATDVSKKPPKI